ncbi:MULTISPECIES: hypothetical protein [Corynebacterium]|uniref:Secreted protein n=1 Tax=Corynebacterium lipophilum TaxID=2804918 RepID=A0AAW5HXS2_9CORY|nr:MULTISPECIES: hypothetical protein [Corynebacterium]MCO6394576.1 hypothetical protein [Corynebacterium lipophilum]MCQ4608750.1 hypothetical protein [Corynebacterium pseudogenitalium]MCQ4613040.1 hypothetical protein [Corynebacterium sp. CCUG 51687]UUA87151.1 hypothetical protein KBP54_10465 [Corynebacterium pseudogenitalium]WPJ93756.1 hypothetical protein R0V12_05330 [Corynebacterium sp. UMB2355A]
MGSATVTGIASIAVGFGFIAAAFVATNRQEIPRAVGYGLAAFVFITVIPVILAVFVAVPNPQ